MKNGTNYITDLPPKLTLTYGRISPLIEMRGCVKINSQLEHINQNHLHILSCQNIEQFCNEPQRTVIWASVVADSAVAVDVVVFVGMVVAVVVYVPPPLSLGWCLVFRQRYTCRPSNHSPTTFSASQLHFSSIALIQFMYFCFISKRGFLFL